MVIKIKDTLYLVNSDSYCLASYKGAYSNEQSLNFVIPIVVLLFLGIIYVMTQRADSGVVVHLIALVFSWKISKKLLVKK